MIYKQDIEILKRDKVSTDNQEHKKGVKNKFMSPPLKIDHTRPSVGDLVTLLGH